jgi:hypothetical protein
MVSSVGLPVFLRPARAMPIRFALPLYDYHSCIFFFFVFLPLKRQKYKKERYNVP